MQLDSKCYGHLCLINKSWFFVNCYGALRDLVGYHAHRLARHLAGQAEQLVRAKFDLLVFALLSQKGFQIVIDDQESAIVIHWPRLLSKLQQRPKSIGFACAPNPRNNPLFFKKGRDCCEHEALHIFVEGQSRRPDQGGSTAIIVDFEIYRIQSAMGYPPYC